MGGNVDRRWLRVAASLSLLGAALSLGTLNGRSDAAFPGKPGKISFDSTRDGNTEIYVMNADGSGQTNLSNDPNTARRPDWQSIPRLKGNRK